MEKTYLKAIHFSTLPQIIYYTIINSTCVVRVYEKKLIVNIFYFVLSAMETIHYKPLFRGQVENTLHIFNIIHTNICKNMLENTEVAIKNEQRTHLGFSPTDVPATSEFYYEGALFKSVLCH